MKRTDGQKRLSARLTNRKAFTLVELLVVIAIIGILFVVLISKVDFATEKAKASGVQTDFRSYQLAIETVARENAGLSTLVNDEASGEEKYAALEAALNKNLDPKLRVEIDENGKISTDAKDPWKEEYTGQYLAPDADGTVKDRGAIVMYSKGSNLKLGSTSETTNGVVNVTIESGKEAEGADDYAISTIYTYVNGYGEIKTTTKGFSNNIGDENTNQGNNTPTNPADPDTPTGPEQGGEQEPVRLAAGLYDAEDNLVASWDELVNTYGMNVEADNINTAPRYVVHSSDALKSGVKMVLPDNITKIGSQSFYNCTWLQYIEMGNNITSIGNNAFSGCSGLTELYFGTGLISIGDSAFYNCSQLSVELLLPNSLTKIGEVAFLGCSGLTGELVIPNNVATIGKNAFNNCSGLTSVIIGPGITNIGEGAFNNCSGLTGVYIADLAAWCRIDFANGLSNPLYYAKNLYLNNTPITNLVIPDEITEIKNHTFRNAQNITGTLTIPDSVTSIGEYAFKNCSGLTSVYISENVENIGIYAFSNCIGLSRVDIVDLVTWCKLKFTREETNPLYYAKNLYLNNQPITDLVIPDEVKEIKAYTFVNAQNITGTLTIHDNVTSIGELAFNGCSGLTGELIIPNSVQFIGTSAFGGCSGLTSVRIGDGVAGIRYNVFQKCSNLINITIESKSLIDYPSSMLSYCESLVTIYVPADLVEQYKAADGWIDFADKIQAIPTT